MPSVKQGGGYTLTFSKKNQDVKEHLDKLKENKVVITDYLCEAVRFFEENKNIETKNQVNHMDIDKIIEEKIKALMVKTTSSIEEAITEQGINKIPIQTAERDLEDTEDIDDEDIEED